ncbi:MAG: VPLPA-CTERM sorting domain-containing protein [Gammaproteobacteria bacterium]|nr:VPLPA-CTERM sorting domain-containing protein [Gammaproteobacteria bacterium]MBU1978861.1 VPLPA-CTERM sorting domain-containing protein [Gammaproteobacteria bacterium]
MWRRFLWPAAGWLLGSGLLGLVGVARRKVA